MGIAGRRIALLVADGVRGDAVMTMHRRLASEGAVPRLVGVALGQVQSASGSPLEVEVTLETAPSVLWDGMIAFDGDQAAKALGNFGHAIEFLKDQYRHCKPILLMGSSSRLLAKAGIPVEVADPGLIAGKQGANTETAVTAFIEALIKHRHFGRETDPPRV
jgi:catalase